MRSARGTFEADTPMIRATFLVPRDLQEAFLRAAKSSDRTGSQEIRRFMREYIDQTDEVAA